MRSATKLKNWLRAHPRIVDFIESERMPQDEEQKWALYDEIQEALKTVPPYTSDRAKIAKTAVVEGNVAILDGASVLHQAVIKGPAFVGTNVVVGDFSLVREGSFLSRDLVVGNHCYCLESVLAPRVRVTHYCGVSRSILERNCCLSAFVLTATLKATREPIVRTVRGKARRRDKMGCVIGESTYIASHVLILPGRVVGRDCFVGSHVVVEKDVASGMRLRSKGSSIVDRNSWHLPEYSTTRMRK